MSPSGVMLSLLAVEKSPDVPPDICCGDCWVQPAGGGTVIIACSTLPQSCGLAPPDCNGKSGDCTYNQSATEDSEQLEGKHCDPNCGSGAGTAIVYDYTSDDCV